MITRVENTKRMKKTSLQSSYQKSLVSEKQEVGSPESKRDEGS
jgi:hypothetical protein